MIQELRKNAQMADVTISDQNAVIKELIRNNTLLEEKAIRFESRLKQKETQIAQLADHISFLGFDRKCS